MIIFSTNEGKLEYQPPQLRQEVPVGGKLLIDATNPAIRIEWRMSRGTLIRMALRCLWAALRR